MKILKWLLISLAALLVLGIAAVVIIVTSYDYNELKPGIIAVVKKETGRDLKLDGDISISLSLSPALVVEGVSFQNAEWGSRPQMVTMKRMELEVGLVPLISGDLEINRLVLIEPDILIETDAQGRSNLDMTPESKKVPRKTVEESPAPKAKPPSKPGEGKSITSGEHMLVLKEVLIKDASLLIKDGQSLQTLDLKLKSLSSRTDSANSPIKFAVEGSYNQEPFKLEGNTGSLTSLTNPAEAWTVKLSGSFAGANWP